MSVNASIDACVQKIMDMVENKYILFSNNIAYCEGCNYMIKDEGTGCVTLVKANSFADAKKKYQQMKANTSIM